MALVGLVFGVLAYFALGSFACVVIDRLPVALDEPNRFGDIYDTRPWGEVLAGRSRCDECDGEVRTVDNIPVVSFLVLRGRCRSCGATIPRFHPWVELAAPVAFLLAVWALGATWLLLPVMWFIPMALAVAVIDLRTLIVPTRVVWPGTVVLLVLSVVAAGLVGGWALLLTALVGAAAVAGPLFLLWFVVPSGMGFGDVRLAVPVGWLVGFYAGTRPVAGLVAGVVTLLVASILGLVLGVVALGVRGRGVKMPFGPALVAAAFAVALLAPRLLEPWGVYSAA